MPHKDEMQPEQLALIEEINQLEMKAFLLVSKLKNMTGPDQRDVALGNTHAEDAFMRLRRSVARGQKDPGYYLLKEGKR